MPSKTVKDKKRVYRTSDKMTGPISLYLNYQTKAKDPDLENDIMLLGIELTYEASKENVKLACRHEKHKQRLRLVLDGEQDRVNSFLHKLKSKDLEYVTADRYSITEPRPHDGATPDWEHHDFVVAAKAAYLRSTYMQDINRMLEQLVKENKSKK